MTDFGFLFGFEKIWPATTGRLEKYSIILERLISRVSRYRKSFSWNLAFRLPESKRRQTCKLSKKKRNNIQHMCDKPSGIPRLTQGNLTAQKFQNCQWGCFCIKLAPEVRRKDQRPSPPKENKTHNKKRRSRTPHHLFHQVPFNRKRKDSYTHALRTCFEII